MPPVLEGLNLHIDAGYKVAICGRTGRYAGPILISLEVHRPVNNNSSHSGKTTLLNSLLQLNAVTAGGIFVDGVDIAMLRAKDIRSRLVALPQETLKMSVSVGQYARIYGISDNEQIIRGLSEVDLWPAIERAGGLDMLLSDESLSHGQRQLLGMTLSCLRKGNIVLMDEPTSQ